LPLLAAAGYWSMLGEVEALGLARVPATLDPGRRAALVALKEHLLQGYFALLAFVVLMRTWRRFARRPA
jgi:hypothetical protein